MTTVDIEILTELLIEREELAERDFESEPASLLMPLIEAISIVVFVADATGNIRYANAAWMRLTGYSLQETRALGLSAYLHPQDHERWLSFLDACKRDPHQGAPVVVLRFLTKSGPNIHLEARAQAITDTLGRCKGFVGTLSDVSSRVYAEDLKEAGYRTIEVLINNLPGLVYRCRNNRQWTMEYASKGCEALTGYPPEALINNDRLTFGDLILPEDRQQVWDNVQIALRENRPFELMYRIRDAQGQEKWVLERGRGNFSKSGELLGLEGFITDVTLERREQLRLRADSLRDVKTQLPIPTLFLDRLEMALRRTKFHQSGTIAVFVVQVDQIAKWRATLGIDFADRALLEVGQRLKSILDPMDSLCLWRENEFAIFHECKDAEVDAITIGSEIQKHLRSPVQDGTCDVFLTLSIGISISATGDEKAENMISTASSAATRARNKGIGRVEIIKMAASEKKSTPRGSDVAPLV